MATVECGRWVICYTWGDEAKQGRDLRSWKSRAKWSRRGITILPFKAKRQWLLTWKVSSYCLLALQAAGGRHWARIGPWLSRLPSDVVTRDIIHNIMPSPLLLYRAQDKSALLLFSSCLQRFFTSSHFPWVVHVRTTTRRLSDVGPAPRDAGPASSERFRFDWLQPP